MERGVEYEHLRLVRHNGETALDAHDVRTGVQRREIAAQLKLGKHVFGQKHGFKEVGTAMHHAVTNGFDLVHGGDHAGFGIGQVLDYDFGGDCVIRHRDVDLDLFAVFALSVLNASVETNALADTLCQDGFGGGVKKLILQGRRTSVDDKNFHENFLRYCGNPAKRQHSRGFRKIQN